MPGEKNEGETKNRILFRDSDRRDGTQERVLSLRWSWEWKRSFLQEMIL
jgi:hypothetical protein